MTTGKALFLEGDQRSAYARRFRDVLALYIADLGGSAAVSESQRSIARRAAFLTVELERIEAASNKGEQIDFDMHQRGANTLRRLLQSIGLRPVVHILPEANSSIAVERFFVSSTDAKI